MRTILTWYHSGGPFMLPLLLVALAGLVLLVERLMAIVLRSRINARPFIERVVSLVRADKVDEALTLCTDHRSALPDLGLVILRSRSREEIDLLSVADASVLTVVPVLTRRLAWLPMLAVMGLLLGTLGAVTNLHDVIASTASDPLAGASGLAAGSGNLLLAGIAYALRPLGAGILTTIPLIAGYAWLRYEAQTTIDQLEEFSARLINALIDRPDVRLGHRSRD